MEKVATNIDTYFEKDLIRVLTIGSVDDGKSTLIGNLLYHTGSVFQDQIDDATFDNGKIDYSRITDGLQSEREQGITIDIAHRYFTTASRKYIFIDSPGHIQYTRNMVTGASRADVAIILIDINNGILEQTKRHAYISSLVGVPHLVVCVNKMDLVHFSKTKYEMIYDDFLLFCQKSNLNFKSIQAIPTSATLGINVVTKSTRETPWYNGPSVYDYLKDLALDAYQSQKNLSTFMLTQCIIRSEENFRGIAGTLNSGTLSTQDFVEVLPTRLKTRIKSMVVNGQISDTAQQGDAVVIGLNDEIDVSRGQLICKENHYHQWEQSEIVTADFVWLSEIKFELQKEYLVKCNFSEAKAIFTHIHHCIDLNTIENQLQNSSINLQTNDIFRADIRFYKSLLTMRYETNRELGSLIVIDPITNNTVAGGMIRFHKSYDTSSKLSIIVPRKETDLNFDDFYKTLAVKFNTEEIFKLIYKDETDYNSGLTQALKKSRGDIVIVLNNLSLSTLSHIEKITSKIKNGRDYILDTNNLFHISFFTNTLLTLHDKLTDDTPFSFSYSKLGLSAFNRRILTLLFIKDE